LSAPVLQEVAEGEIKRQEERRGEERRGEGVWHWLGVGGMAETQS
jgi:hypothetical protein